MNKEWIVRELMTDSSVVVEDQLNALSAGGWTLAQILDRGTTPNHYKLALVLSRPKNGG